MAKGRYVADVRLYYTPSGTTHRIIRLPGVRGAFTVESCQRDQSQETELSDDLAVQALRDPETNWCLNCCNDFAETDPAARGLGAAKDEPPD